jgi:hypothetical protein
MPMDFEIPDLQAMLQAKIKEVKESEQPLEMAKQKIADAIGQDGLSKLTVTRDDSIPGEVGFLVDGPPDLADKARKALIAD